VTFNPNACTTQKYSIVEDLAQVHCDMPTLEVLQNCSSKIITMVPSIGAMDPKNLNMITFNLYYFKERISHHLTLKIQISVGGKNIHHTILHEGASTCVLSFPCWKALGSPKLTLSPTTLKAFDGCGFQPHEVLQSFAVTLKGKIFSVEF
jgi:hypothetical protein